MSGIGLRIKKRREEINMTQEELAKKVGYTSRTTVNKIENGVNDVKQNMIVKFAKALGVTPSYLMGWESEPVDYIVYDGELSSIIKEISQRKDMIPTYVELFDKIMRLDEHDLPKAAKALDIFIDK